MPALADAALDAQERALLGRFVSALRAAEPFELSEARTLVATAERLVAEVERLAG